MNANKEINPKCPICSGKSIKYGVIPNLLLGNKQRYRCTKCGKTFYSNHSSRRGPAKKKICPHCGNDVYLRFHGRVGNISKLSRKMERQYEKAQEVKYEIE